MIYLSSPGRHLWQQARTRWPSRLPERICHPPRAGNRVFPEGTNRCSPNRLLHKREYAADRDSRGISRIYAGVLGVHELCTLDRTSDIGWGVRAGNDIRAVCVLRKI